MMARADDQAADLIRRTRTDRGLPSTIEDPKVVGRVARILAPQQTCEAETAA
jgi:hypothetical protein